MPDQDGAIATAQRMRRHHVLRLIGIGSIGLVAVAIEEAPRVESWVRTIPDFPGIPLPVLAGLSVFQPAVLLVLASWAGVRFAPRVGIKSLIAGIPTDSTTGLRRADVMIALLVGALLAFFGVAVDSLTGGVRDANIVRHVPIRGLSAAVLYGGITEEVIFRWGLLSMLAAGMQRFTRGRSASRPRILWIATLITALVFGTAHLPALGEGTVFSTYVMVRTIGLNAVAGLCFGLLAWRRNLETAMISHGFSHVVLAVLLAI